MTEEHTTNDAGQPVDRLGEIKARMDADIWAMAEEDTTWLVAEVERLRLLLRDIGLNTKHLVFALIMEEKNHPQDIADFVLKVETMTREWAE